MVTAVTPHTTSAPPPLPRRTGLLGWAHAWRLAARMSWRDILRHRRRSAVILAMIALPIVVLTLAASYYQTYASSDYENYGRYGNATAIVTAPRVHDAVAAARAGTYRPSPVFPQASDVADDAAALRAIERFTGTRVTPDATHMFRGTHDDGRPWVGYVRSFDPSHPATAPLLNLQSGRLPTSPTELLVSPRGRALGLPTSGPVTLRLDDLHETKGNGIPRAFTVVGVADVAASAPLQQADAFFPAAPDHTFCLDQHGAAGPRVDDGPTTPCPILLGGTQLSRDAITALEAAGVPVYFPGDQRGGETHDSSLQEQNVQVGALIALVLFIEMVALVGPAFAISAAQRRRTVALGLMNGATPAHGRRLLLSQALILGVLGAVGAVVLGLGLFVGGTAALRAAGFVFSPRPLDVPWGWLLAMILFASVAAVVAALLPARGLSRMDVSVLTQRPAGDPPASRWLAWAGATLLLVSTAVTISALGDYNAFVRVGCAGVGLLLGGILLLPAALSGITRLLRRAPVEWRLASRDALRHRRRTVPAIAAILGVTAVLTAAGLVAGVSLTQSDRMAEPSAPVGWAYSRIGHPAAAAAATAQLGTLTGNRVIQLHDTSPAVDNERRETGLTPDVGLITGCTVTSAKRVAPGCPTAPFVSFDGRRTPFLTAGTLDDLATLGKLTAADREVLNQGGILTDSPRGIKDGTATIGISSPYRAAADAHPDGLPPMQVERSVTVPARPFSPGREGALWSGYRNEAIVMTLDTARRHGLPLRVAQVLSPVTDDARLAAIRNGTHNVGYEAAPGGPRRVALTSAVIALAALLITLICTMTTTSLTLHEQRRDLATASALGATARTRRRFAAYHAFLVAGLGAAMGVLLGIVWSAPQVLVYLQTYRGWGPYEPEASTVELVLNKAALLRWEDVPWQGLLGVLIVVPVLAALSATFLARTEPVLDRRRRS